MELSSPYLTTREVALLVRRSPWTIRRWTREGRLRAVLIGGRLLVTEADLLALARPAGSFRKKETQHDG